MQTGTEAVSSNPENKIPVWTGDVNATVNDASWPDNEFTKLLSKPSSGTLYGASTDSKNGKKTFTVLWTDITHEELEAYVEAVKSCGFNLNESLEEPNDIISIYSFTAENKDGYTVKITSAFGVNSIVISK